MTESRNPVSFSLLSRVLKVVFRKNVQQHWHPRRVEERGLDARHPIISVCGFLDYGWISYEEIIRVKKVCRQKWIYLTNGCSSLLVFGYSSVHRTISSGLLSLSTTASPTTCHTRIVYIGEGWQNKKNFSNLFYMVRTTWATHVLKNWLVRCPTLLFAASRLCTWSITRELVHLSWTWMNLKFNVSSRNDVELNYNTSPRVNTKLKHRFPVIMTPPWAAAFSERRMEWEKYGKYRLFVRIC